MTTVAAYDAYADWYEDYLRGAAAAHTDRVRALAARLVGRGAGPCLDVCCGTGLHAGPLRELGWTPIGVDVSLGQLRHARSRLPVAAADATRLPIAAGALPLAVCTMGHTDVPDYRAVLAELARTLCPGGRLVHIGVHPCFTGAFADRSNPARIVIGPGYAVRDRSFEGWAPHGVRARVGAWHATLADLLGGVLGAGLRLAAVAEDGPADGVPDLFGLVAVKD
ncbi:MAG TPA: class I SAM-dependent methyltransferase [Micromonosporaceae bacterium]|jgi:SAM-dependent methyltransferase